MSETVIIHFPGEIILANCFQKLSRVQICSRNIPCDSTNGSKPAVFGLGERLVGTFVEIYVKDTLLNIYTTRCEFFNKLSCIFTSRLCTFDTTRETKRYHIQVI